MEHQAVSAGPGDDPGLSSHVVSAATFLGLVYPGRGLDKTIRKEHLNSMTTADFVKVWQVGSVQLEAQFPSSENMPR